MFITYFLAFLIRIYELVCQQSRLAAGPYSHARLLYLIISLYGDYFSPYKFCIPQWVPERGQTDARLKEIYGIDYEPTDMLDDVAAAIYC